MMYPLTSIPGYSDAAPTHDSRDTARQSVGEDLIVEIRLVQVVDKFSERPGLHDLVLRACERKDIPGARAHPVDVGEPGQQCQWIVVDRRATLIGVPQPAGQRLRRSSLDRGEGFRECRPPAGEIAGLTVCVAPAVVVVTEGGGAVDPTISKRAGEDRLHVPGKGDRAGEIGRRGSEDRALPHDQRGRHRA